MNELMVQEVHQFLRQFFPNIFSNICKYPFDLLGLGATAKNLNCESITHKSYLGPAATTPSGFVTLRI